MELRHSPLMEFRVVGLAIAQRPLNTQSPMTVEASNKAVLRQVHFLNTLSFLFLYVGTNLI